MRTITTVKEFNKFRIVREDDLVWIEKRILIFFWTKVWLNHDSMTIETWYNVQTFSPKIFKTYGRAYEDLDKFFWYEK